MSRYRAAVIGLGKAGLEYDYSSILHSSPQQTPNSRVLSHSQGYFEHPDFELVGGVDTNVTQRERFNSKFNITAYSSVEELLSRCQPDVVSIVTPTSNHLESLDHVLRVPNNIKLILCEKPLAEEELSAKIIVSQCESHGVMLAVNYKRRFDPGIIEVQNKIKSGALGPIYKGTVWYTKGLINNASHYLNLLQSFFGEVTSVQVLSAGRKWQNSDPEPDFLVRFNEESLEICFFAAREENYSLGEISLVGEKGRLQLVNECEDITLNLSEFDPILGHLGYRSLSSDGIRFTTNMGRSQLDVLTNVAAALRGKASLLSDGHSALRTAEEISKIASLTSLTKPKLKTADGAKALMPKTRLSKNG